MKSKSAFVIAGLATLLLARAPPAEPRKILVDAAAPGPIHDGISWETAFTTLQAGIDAAMESTEPEPDQVWVKAGTYKPPTDDSSFLLKLGVHLYGGFVGTENPMTFNPAVDPRPFMLTPERTESPTILSGDLEDNDDDNHEQTFADNCPYIVQSPGFDPDPELAYRLDGFTIIGAVGNAVVNWDFGNGIYRRCTFRDNRSMGGGINQGGAALYISQSRPIIDQCDFLENTAIGLVGGGAIKSFISSPTITDCTFTRNMCINGALGQTRGGGALFSEGTVSLGSPKVRHCKFENNEAFNGSGGAAYTDGGVAHVFVDCEFRGNRAARLSESAVGMLHGGAIFSHISGFFVNCVFDSNLVVDVLPNVVIPFGQGGGLYIKKQMQMTNCLLYGNVAESGGGLFVENAALTASHLTIADNGALSEGAGVYVNDELNFGGGATFSNSIFWGNRGDENLSIADQQVFLGEPDIPLSVEYSCLEDDLADGDAFPGTGNLDYDPVFYSPIIADYRVTVCSPVIDVGEWDDTPEDNFDVDDDDITLDEKTPDLDLNIRDLDVPSFSPARAIRRSTWAATSFNSIGMARCCWAT